MEAKPRFRELELATLKPAPYNPRTISDRAMAGLEASLKRFGVVQPIIWNERTGYVVGGHQRLKALAASGVTSTTVIVVDLDELQEKQLNIELNNPHVAGEFTAELQGLLGEIQLADPGAFGELRLDELVIPVLPTIGEDEDTELEATPEPTAKIGDLWLLGPHRVFCGDATNPDHVRLACGDLEPWIMVTDPPYGVSYDPAWRDEAAAKGMDRRTSKATKTGKVQNDDRADWGEAYSLFPGVVAYVWQGQLQVGPNQLALQACGFEPRTLIIWRKPHFAISRGHYHPQMESAWYACRKGHSAKWCGDRKQSTVWDIAPPKGKDESNHGTQKPIEAMLRPMMNHGAPGDVVYDPFLGSGTTLLAAHKSGRVCVGLELDPGYVDTICRRWNALGLEPARLAE